MCFWITGVMGYSDLTVPESDHIRALMNELTARHYSVSKPSISRLPTDWKFNNRDSTGYEVRNAVFTYKVAIVKISQFVPALLYVFCVPNARNVPAVEIYKGHFRDVTSVTADDLEEVFLKPMDRYLLKPTNDPQDVQALGALAQNAHNTLVAQQPDSFQALALKPPTIVAAQDAEGKACTQAYTHGADKQANADGLYYAQDELPDTECIIQ